MSAVMKTEVVGHRYVAGVVNYRAYDDLALCLGSLKAQSLHPAAIHVIDCESDRGRLETLRRRFPDVSFEAVANLGYAAGANRILGHAAELRPTVEFVLILNSDVRLEPGFSEALLDELANRPGVALASGKLLRPDGRTLDSAGIVMSRNRRPWDRGSGEQDEGRFDRVEEIFGASGAALMLRRAALSDLEVEGEIFDEDFFAYHEDTDLAWRARRMGWASLYVPRARALHKRGWRREDRWSVPVQIRRHSFKNHYLEIIKNDRAADLLWDLPVILAWEIVRLGYVLVRDRGLLGGYALAWRHARRAWRKRRLIQERARRRRAGRGPRA